MPAPHPHHVPVPRAPRQRRALAYRPGLDGIRALAVLAVFGHHAAPHLVPGGWLGVDVFFVLSGFLITSLLLAEWRERGTISLTGFWLARARRLLPALVLVLLAVLAASAVWLAPVRRSAVAGDALAALLYVANWRFLLGDESYFATLAMPSPLRHTWSLAVEEQFYLIFPLLLLVLIRMLRTRRRVALALGLLAAGSALWMAHLYTPGTDPGRVYYGTDTRAQELLVGSALATLLAPTHGPVARLTAWVTRWPPRLVLPAALLLLVSFVTVDPQTPWLFRGGMVGFALVTAIVIITAWTQHDSMAHRLLAAEWLRRIGLVSYGIYLWHWPVLVFLDPARVGIDGVALLLLRAALTGILAFLSYRFVERPIRRWGLAGLIPRMPQLGPVVAVGGSAAALVGIVVLPLTTAFRPAGAHAGQGIAYAASTGRPTPRAAVSDAAPTEGRDLPAGATPPATLPAVPPQRSVLLVGNSVPYSLAAFFPAQGHPRLRVDQHTTFGCDIVDAPKVVDGAVVPTNPDCTAWRSGIAATASRVDPDIALLFLSHPLLVDHVVDGVRLAAGGPEHAAYLRGQLTHLVEQLRAAGVDHVAIVNLACHRLPSFGTNEEITRTNTDSLVRALNAEIGAWARADGIPVIDQYGFLCGGGYADRINGVQLYADGFHFTSESAPIVWSWLAPQLLDLADAR